MTRLTTEQRTLAEHFMPLAMSLVQKHGLKYLDVISREELESAALLALTEAAGRYQPYRGISFARFARPAIRGAIQDAIRKALLERARPSGALWLIVDDSRGGVEQVDAVEAFDALIALAPAKYHRLLRLVFGLGLTQLEASQVLGCTQPRISALLAEAIMCLQSDEPIVRLPSRRRMRRVRRA